MIIAANWKPSICKLFLPVQLIYMAVKYTAPTDQGSDFGDDQMRRQLLVIFSLLSYSAIVPILLQILFISYIMLVRIYMY